MTLAAFASWAFDALVKALLIFLAEATDLASILASFAEILSCMSNRKRRPSWFVGIDRQSIKGWGR